MKALSVREVIETARKVTGHSIPALETARRAGDPAKLVASSEKAKKFSVEIQKQECSFSSMQLYFEKMAIIHR